MFGPLLRSPTLCEVDGWSHDGEQISTEALPVSLDITSVTIVGVGVGDVLARHGRVDVLLNNVGVRCTCLLVGAARRRRHTRALNVNFLGQVRTSVASRTHGRTLRFIFFFSVRTVLGRG